MRVVIEPRSWGPSSSESEKDGGIEVEQTSDQGWKQHVRASPAARRRAAELGLDIDDLAATLGNRVTVAKIEAHAIGSTSEWDDGAPPTRSIRAVSPGGPSRANRAISPLTLQHTVDVTRLEAGRQRHRDAGAALPLVGFVVKACTIALREHPRMNASVLRRGRALAIKRHICVVERASVGVVPESASFYVTHVPSFGAQFGPSSSGSPRIGIRPVSLHSGHVAGLGLGRPRHQDDRVLLPISLVYDPRANDEGAAEAFLATLVNLLGDPITMLLRA